MQMTSITKCPKTIWQHIYSFFGFWSYISVRYTKPTGYRIISGYTRMEALKALGKSDSDTITTRTWYWCCLPWFKFYRKFDILTYRIRNEE